MDIKKLFTGVTDENIEDIQNNSTSFLLITKNESESDSGNVKLTTFHNCRGKNDVFSYLFSLEIMILRIRDQQKSVAKDNGLDLDDGAFDSAINEMSELLKKENETCH